MTSTRDDRTRLSRRDLLKTVAAGTGAAALGSLGFPAVLRSQPDAVRIGHITPRTGFLGQLGEYGLNAAMLAVEEANAAGGVLGRKVELIAEDSVNPGVAVTKVQKLVERDRVLGLLGEISSASALAIGEQANRYKVVYINTGANSDELRGKNCNRFMFHVEGCNTMYTKTIGQWQKSKNLIRGAKWYMLTADYAFGHDLFRVSSRFLTENGGTVMANDMVPTNTTDYSAYILKIRQAKPDFVYINLAGIDQTSFLKQYKEFNLPFPLAGGVMDTVPFWAAGIDSLSGHWQSLWYHGLTLPAAQAFTKRFADKYGKPPDNQAWGGLRRREDPAPGHGGDQEQRGRQVGRLLREGRHLRHPEGAQGQLPRLGPSAAAGDVCGPGQGQEGRQGQVGHLRAGPDDTDRQRVPRADPAHQAGKPLHDGVSPDGRSPHPALSPARAERAG